jgi:hypothetical protein
MRIVLLVGTGSPIVCLPLEIANSFSSNFFLAIFYSLSRPSFPPYLPMPYKAAFPANSKGLPIAADSTTSSPTGSTGDNLSLYSKS